MDVFGVQYEYEWVVKILKSSKTISHINMSDKILSFFIKKWDGILNEDQKNTFLYDFIGIKTEIIEKIEKNHSMM
jgi:hypothetical protein